ncbi:MAG: hypothetical protein KDD53_05970, partial [Bdellovibrionales bacterium]|nr:hypothetical protein [Bdellovibrionales bacterium]
APIYEMLTLSDELRRMVLLGASKTELTLQARSEGMQTLRESGIELVKKGVTTLEEVLGVTNDDSDVASAESALANPIKMQTSTPAQTTVITAPDQNHTAVKDQATATNHTDSANVSPAEESAVKGSVDSDEVKEKARQAALRWKMLKESREGSKEEDPAPAT